MWPFTKKPEQVMRVSPPPTTVPARNILGTPLRLGMWVVAGTKVGILVGLSSLKDPGGIPLAEVVLVDPASGLNIPDPTTASHKLVSLEMLLNLRQARHDEIPEGRRPHPQHSANLGYN